MRIRLEYGKLPVDKPVMLWDTELRKLFPRLVGWSYSYDTGELELDFGEEIEQLVKSRCEEANTRLLKKVKSIVLGGREIPWEEFVTL